MPDDHLHSGGPVVFDPFATEADFQLALDELAAVRFSYGAISTDPRLPIWRGDIGSRSRLVQMALTTINERLGASFELVSAHINLQTHGLDGAFHVDSDDRLGRVTHALNWYVHACEWPKEFGGYLLIGEDAKRLLAILPARNTAVLIPAHYLHCAVSPFLHAGAAARISFTAKLRTDDAI